MNWAYTPTGDNNGNNFGPIDQGYYITQPSEADGVTPLDPANHFPSGFLTNAANDTISLWITQASISFQTSGLTAQSMRMREYFPRYLVQPKWTIQGIVPNSFQYQRLAEFIRQSHFDALFPAGTATAQSGLLGFTINAGNFLNGKGPHAPQVMRGFIKTFGRGAERFVFAPTYQFDFEVIFSYGDLLITQDYQSIVQTQQTNSQSLPNQPDLNNYANLGTGQIVPNINLGS